MANQSKAIIENTIERAQYFQTVQVWPLSSELNYIGWLNNFKKKQDKELACMILDFFQYYLLLPCKIVPFY